MNIKILGSGCKNCARLEENAKKATTHLALDATIEKVSDFKEMMKYGVMKTPALVVDETVKSQGKVLSQEEIIRILNQA